MLTNERWVDAKEAKIHMRSQHYLIKFTNAYKIRTKPQGRHRLYWLPDVLKCAPQIKGPKEYLTIGQFFDNRVGDYGNTLCKLMNDYIRSKHKNEEDHSRTRDQHS